MEITDYLKQFDGLGLAELIRTKQVKPTELLEESIERIESLNPALNAVIHKRYESALKEVDTLSNEGPFAGVPILLKDVNQEMKGEPMTFGSKAYKGHISERDSRFVHYLRESGVQIVGTTNVPEFALMAITEPKFYGPTRNPWNDQMTSGGSSGGSAVAVATGMVPIAGASDGGGSIRIPAAYNGLFGLKPTRGRTPVGPQSGRHWQGASASHVLTRSVRDSAAMLDCLSKTDKGGAFSADPQNSSYLEIIKKPLENRLKIAYSLKSPIGTPVDEDCKAAVLGAVNYLESSGHYIEELEAPVDGKKLAKSYIMMYFAEVNAQFRELKGVLGRKINRSDVEPTTWLLGALGETISAGDFVESLKEWDRAAFIMEQFHETYDFYITPTTGMQPAKIGELALKPVETALVHLIDKWGVAKLISKMGIIDSIIETSLKQTPFTQLANLTGQPAVSLPLYFTKEGLPLGVQVIAARGREDLLFQLAAELEQCPLWVDVTKNPYWKN